jgi:hypothetical protein
VDADNERAARRLADELRAARRATGVRIELARAVHHGAPPARHRVQCHRCAAIEVPSRHRASSIGLTAHIDHLGVDQADARGDSIYNGFLDDAMGMAMVIDVARRYAAAREIDHSS